MSTLLVQPAYIASLDRRAAEGFFRVDLKRNDAPHSNNLKVIQSDEQLMGMDGRDKTLYVLATTFNGRRHALMAIAHLARVRRFEVRFV